MPPNWLLDSTAIQATTMHQAYSSCPSWRLHSTGIQTPLLQLTPVRLCHGWHRLPELLSQLKGNPLHHPVWKWFDPRHHADACHEQQWYPGFCYRQVLRQVSIQKNPWNPTKRVTSDSDKLFLSQENCAQLGMITKNVPVMGETLHTCNINEPHTAYDATETLPLDSDIHMPPRVQPAHPFIFFLLKCLTLQNKAHHKNKTKDDTYNITDTNKKMTNEQINANTNVILQT